MELLSDFNSSDPIGQILRLVRVRSTIFCRSSMGAPWGFGVEAHGQPAFHVVVAGSCWLDVEGEPGQLALEAGDLVVLPTGRRHWLRDDPASPAPELEQILAHSPLDEHRRLQHGGHGVRTTLLCGGFGLDGADPHPILRALPSVLHVRGVAGRPVPWLAATLALLSAETASDAPGAEEVVCRLADTLLTRVLRVALTELGASGEAGVTALCDPHIAAAIQLIHQQPERGWTVGELADAVALSRSAFAARFRRLVGESPKRYVTRTLLAHAAAALHQTDAPLAAIAAQAGYATEFSFSKAFKRTFGTPPGAYRDEQAPPPPRTRSVRSAAELETAAP